MLIVYSLHLLFIYVFDIFRMEKDDYSVVAGIKARTKAHSWGISLMAIMILGVIISNVMMYNFVIQRIDQESQDLANLKVAIGNGDYSSQVSFRWHYQQNTKLVLYHPNYAVLRCILFVDRVILYNMADTTEVLLMKSSPATYIFIL